MSIQHSSPEFQGRGYSDESLQKEAPASHLTLVPQPVDEIATPSQPVSSHTYEQAKDAVSSAELLAALLIGEVDGVKCYGVPRSSQGRYQP